METWSAEIPGDEPIDPDSVIVGDNLENVDTPIEPDSRIVGVDLGEES